MREPIRVSSNVKRENKGKVSKDLGAIRSPRGERERERKRREKARTSKDAERERETS